jgi:hypothetical protein
MASGLTAWNGVPYANIATVFTLGSLMQTGIDAGTFADDGNNPPLAYTFTIGGGSMTYTLAASAISGVAVQNATSLQTEATKRQLAEHLRSQALESDVPFELQADRLLRRFDVTPR